MTSARQHDQRPCCPAQASTYAVTVRNRGAAARAQGPGFARARMPAVSRPTRRTCCPQHTAELCDLRSHATETHLARAGARARPQRSSWLLSSALRRRERKMAPCRSARTMRGRLHDRPLACAGLGAGAQARTAIVRCMRWLRQDAASTVKARKLPCKALGARDLLCGCPQPEGAVK